MIDRVSKLALESSLFNSSFCSFSISGLNSGAVPSVISSSFSIRTIPLFFKFSFNFSIASFISNCPILPCPSEALAEEDKISASLFRDMGSPFQNNMASILFCKLLIIFTNNNISRVHFLGRIHYSLPDKFQHGQESHNHDYLFFARSRGDQLSVEIFEIHF